MRFVLALVCLVLALGCDMADKKQSAQEYNPPSFMVEMFDYVNKSTPDNTTDEHGLTSYAVSDPPCEAEMTAYNDATEATQVEFHVCMTNINEEHKQCETAEDGTIHLHSELALMMTRHSHTQALFRNCLMQEDKDYYNFSIVTNDEEKTSYRGGSIGDPLLDNTRFIGWREYKNDNGVIDRTDGEADIVDGEMIMLHLQKEDKHRTQNRIDLTKRNALRQISTLGWTHNPGENGGYELHVAHNAHMVEFDDGNNKEQLLSLRYYGGHIAETTIATDGTENEQPSSKVWLVLAHMKASGATILTAVCQIKDEEDYNKDCSADVLDGDFRLHYVDADGNEQENDNPNLPPAGFDSFKQTVADFVTNEQMSWAHGDYDKEKLDPRRVLFEGSQNDDLDTKREAVFTNGLPEDGDSNT